MATDTRTQSESQIRSSELVWRLEKALVVLSEIKGALDDDNAVTRAYMETAMIDVLDALEIQRTRAKRSSPNRIA